ncbi:MAG: PP0621 family protein [Gammaproteobacteria bacterium]
MGLTRLILLLAIVWLAVAVLRRWRRSDRVRGHRGRTLGEMARCEHCGVYVATREAVQRDGRYYCGPEHAQQAGPGKRK